MPQQCVHLFEDLSGLVCCEADRLAKYCNMHLVTLARGRYLVTIIHDTK